MLGSHCSDSLWKRKYVRVVIGESTRNKAHVVLENMRFGRIRNVNIKSLKAVIQLPCVTPSSFHELPTGSESLYVELETILTS